MTAWIFQSKPQQYDLREELEVGSVEPWMATRYRSEMREGDTVYFWLAGSPDIRGIYGRGKIVGEPYRHSDGGPVVDVKVDKTFHPPLTVSKIKSDIKLRKLDILRVPIGTNFRLDQEQIEALEKHLSGLAAP